MWFRQRITLSFFRQRIQRCYATQKTTSPHIAIVGSGPAGFYTAQQILKGCSKTKVDVFDKLPVPFGLVRFGVAPDHPEVKNVITTFNKTASNERCKFYGNVTVGEDVSVGELCKAYSAVVLAYGAEGDRTFGIPGEDLKGVYSARSFVGWYNGLPENADLQPCLDSDTAVVFGQGNVAVDAARILLTPVDILRKTDITEYALETLSKSSVRRVFLVGRRGPLQVAFTTAELREMVRLESTRPILDKSDFTGLDEMVGKIVQKRKRLTQLLLKTALEEPSEKDALRWSNASREWGLKFLRSPTEFLGQERLTGVRMALNKLEGDDPASQKAVKTDLTEDLECGIAFRSIGYRSTPLPDAPFSKDQAIVPNTMGRVTDHPGLYCSGWVKRGPVGVIVSTMTDAFETGKILIDDLNNGVLDTEKYGQRDGLLALLEQRGCFPVTFDEWKKIDSAEVIAGETIGKPREKLTDIDTMIKIAKDN